MTSADSQEGTLIRQVQLVWVASEEFELPRGRPLPLAFSLSPFSIVVSAPVRWMSAAWHGRAYLLHPVSKG